MSDNLTPEQYREALMRAAESADLLSREFDPLVSNSKDLSANAKKAGADLGKFGKQLGTAIGDMAKAATTASTETGKYSDGLTKGTGAVAGFVATMGPLGKLGGFLIEIFGKLAGAGLKQNDVLMKNYQQLSSFGAINTSDIKKVLTDLQSVGFSPENAEKFSDALKSVAPELALFGGTVASGKNRLISVFQDTLGKTETELMRFGYTTEEMFKYTSSYVAQQARSGAARLKTDAQLNQESVKYMETLAEISALTGASRDDIDKKRREQENDIRYQVYLRKLDLGSAEDQQKAANIRKGIDALYAAGATKTAEGLKSLTINQGRLFDESAVETRTLLGDKGFGAWTKMINAGADSTKEYTEFAQAAGAESSRKLDQFGTVLGSGNDALNGFFSASDAYRLTLHGESVDRKKLASEQTEIQRRQKDDRIKEVADKMLVERKLQIATDNLTYSLGTLSLKAVGGFNNILNVASRTLAKMVKFFTGGQVDYTKEFRTAFDAIDESREVMEKYQKTQKEINKLEEQKKKTLEGSEEHKMLSKHLDSLKEQRSGQARKLYGLNKEHTQMGGGGFIKSDSNLMKDLKNYGGIDEHGGSTGEQKQQKNYSTEDISKLFKFTGATGSQANFEKLDGSLKQSLLEAASKYSEATNGGKLQINSGFRSLEDQTRLYKEYVARGKTGTPVAPPGNSKHQFGQAVDIQNYNDPAAIRALRDAGLVNNIANDPQHFEKAYNGGIFDGPKTGYLVEHHGKEGVFNEQQMSAISNAITKNSFSNTSGSSQGMNEDLSKMATAIVDQLELLADKLTRMHQTQEEILTYTKA